MIVFFLLIILVTATSSAIFHRYKVQIKADKQQELEGIAELKISQISNWINERKGDAQSLKDDPLFLEEVQRWQQLGSPNGEIKSKLTGRLSSLVQAGLSYGLYAITLFDVHAVPQLIYGENTTSLNESEQQLLLESLHTGRIIFSDIHLETKGTEKVPEIDLVMPLVTNAKHGNSRTLGLVMFHIDPRIYLFPFIQRWPTSSPSAETVLIRREDNEVVFMNQLRHTHNSPLNLRIPLSRQELLGVKAVMGQEGVMEGLDYRGVPVVGMLNRVNGIPWFMVSKIDQEEIYAPINQLAIWLELLVLILVSAAGLISYFWQQRLKNMFQTEIQKHLLTTHLDYLAKYANDIILLHDDTGKMIDYNDRALEAYGYTAEEFSTINMSTLRAAALTPSLAEKLHTVNLSGGALRIESVHAKKNGIHFSVEVSVRRIDSAGKTYYQNIVRDITERKKVEKELVSQKEFMRQIIDSVPNLIHVKDAEGRILLVNEAMAKIYGQTTQSIIGKFSRDLTDTQEHTGKYPGEHRKVIEQLQSIGGNNTAVLINGKRHFFITARKPLIQDDGSVNVLTVAMDITSLKETETQLQTSNRALRLLSACNDVMVSIQDEKQLMKEICKLIVDSGSYRMAWIGFAEQDQDKSIIPVAQYGFDEGYLESINFTWADTEQGQGPTGSSIRTGETQLNLNFMENPLKVMQQVREKAKARGYLSSIALPLLSDTETFGVLSIYSSSTESFNTGEIKLLEELADNLSRGITGIRLRNGLEKERIHLQSLVRSIPDLVWIKDTDGIFVNCNRQVELLYGATQAGIIGKTDYDFVDKETADSFRKYDCKVMLSEQPSINKEWLTFLSNGYTGFFETIKTPMYNEKGELVGVLGVARDISEHLKLERELQELHADLSATLQAIPDILFELGPNGEFINIWTNNQERLGVQNEALYGHNVSEILSSEATGTIMSSISEADKNGSSNGKEMIIALQDGNHHYEISTSVKSETNLRAKSYLVLSREITERVQNEKIIRIHSEIFKCMSEGVFLIRTRDQAIVFTNSQFDRMFGYDPGELIGKPVSVVNAQHNSNPEEVAKKINEELMRNGVWNGEVLNIKKNGMEFWCSASVATFEHPEFGQVWVAAHKDINDRKLAEEREQRLRNVLNSTLDMIFIFHSDSRKFIYANKGAVDNIGYSKDELLLMTPSDIQPQLSDEELGNLIAPLFNDVTKTIRYETMHKRKNGSQFPVEVQLQLVQEAGKEGLFITIVRDITERMNAQLELIGQKAFMWQVIDTDPNQIFVKDVHGKFIFANCSASRIHDLTPNEMIGKHVTEIYLSKKEADEVLTADGKVLSEGNETRTVQPYKLSNGELLWFLTIKKRLIMPDGSLSVLDIAVDVTQQKLSEMKQEESYLKLQLLTAHMENIKENERTRIARELHDEMGATLAALKMRVAWLASKLPPEMLNLVNEAALINGLIAEGIETVRNIVGKLRPTLLEDVGICAAIEHCVRQFRLNTNIECILVFPEDGLELEANKSATIFRILQESLSNVSKHAHANNVQILFTRKRNSLMMVIEDDGLGFTHQPKDNSFGILGIKERALMIGGKAKIASVPGKGTRVSVTIPAPDLNQSHLESIER